MKTAGILLIVWVVAIGMTQAAEPTIPSTWQAGTAKAIITPDLPFWLAGYASRTQPADGKLHDLWVKVLVLEDAQHRKAAVVTTDLLGIPKPLGDAVADQLEKQLGLQRSQIMLTSSHTHSGPVLSHGLSTVYPMDEKQCALSDEYTRHLEQIIVKTVVEAFTHMKPATLSAGMGVCSFAVNRRNNVEQDVPRLLEQHESLKGPVDHNVPVLAVHNVEGQLQAVLFLYACHNTTLSLQQYSGDYAGFAQLAVEAKHPEAIAMFAMGCGADQNPLPRRTVELCQKYGNVLAESVETVLSRPMKSVEPSLHTAFERVDLPFDGTLNVDELTTQAAKNDYLGRWAKQTLDRIAKLKSQGEELPKSYPYPVQVWRLGKDQYWIALGGEVVVDYSLSFRAKFGPNTWVGGYANDVMAYIPNRRVWQEGGYESNAFNVYDIAAVRWCPDIEGRITAAVEQLMTQVQSDSNGK